MHRFSAALLPSLHAFMGSPGKQSRAASTGRTAWPMSGGDAVPECWSHAGRIRCVGEAALQPCVIRADKRVPALITA